MKWQDKFDHLSREDKEMFYILAFMSKTKNFDENIYLDQKKKAGYANIIVIGVVSACLSLPYFIQNRLILMAWVLIAAITLGTCSLFQLAFFNEFAKDASFAKNFFELQKFHPDLTAREYFEQTKAKLMSDYEKTEII